LAFGEGGLPMDATVHSRQPSRKEPSRSRNKCTTNYFAFTPACAAIIAWPVQIARQSRVAKRQRKLAGRKVAGTLSKKLFVPQGTTEITCENLETFVLLPIFISL
jgi:hypothetical protein